MSWRRQIAKFGALLRRRTLADDLNEEIRAHLALEEQENRERGLTPEEAHYAALRRFGNVTQAQERSREIWGWQWLETLLQDLRYGLRQLRRNPGFTAVAVITLALGIGANTAIFSLIDAAMLKTLPVAEPGNLVILRWTAHELPKTATYSESGPCLRSGSAPEGCSFPYSVFLQFRSSDAFSGVLATNPGNQLTAIVNGSSSYAMAELVSGDYFSTLRVPNALGRPIELGDDSAAAPSVAVLSYGYWMAEFGGRRSVIGSTLVLNGIPFTVVGVAAPRFAGLQPAMPTDLWVPLAKTHLLYQDWGPEYTSLSGRAWWLWVLGRMRPGLSQRQTVAALDVKFGQAVMSGAKPAFKPGDKPIIHLASASTGLGLLEFLFAKPLLLLMAGVGLVLLIACANLANLMLARETGRQREIATRIALGAGRWRVARQLLTESLLLAGVGGAAGLLLALWGSRALASFISISGWFGPLSINVSPDHRVIAFTAVVALLTGVLFGLAPAFRGGRLDLANALKAGPGSASGGAHRGRRGILRSALTVWQLALVVPLLAGAGLFIRTIHTLESVNPGFNPRKLLLFDLAPALGGYKGGRLITLYNELLQHFDALPGVTSASLANTALVAGNLNTGDIWIQGRLAPSENLDLLYIGPEFLKTVGIPLLAGRSMSQRDFTTNAHVALVNRALARQYFTGESPLGLHFGWTRQKAADFEIVGIVGNTKYDDLRKATEPTVYLPQTSGFCTFELRTAVNPKALIPAVRKAVGQVDPNLPVANFRTQTAQIKQTLFQQRLLSDLSSLFAALALALVCVGLYGVVSYGVAQRTNEIGIRMALGAQRSDVLKLVVGQGLRMTLIGVAIGIGAALVLTRFLSSLLFDVKPTDPLTFIAVSLVLICVALLASYIPARRAAKVDPMVALRYE
jgi:predicted permease